MCTSLIGYKLYTDLKISEVAALFQADPFSLLAANSIDSSLPGVANRILPSARRRPTLTPELFAFPLRRLLVVVLRLLLLFVVLSLRLVVVLRLLLLLAVLVVLGHLLVILCFLHGLRLIVVLRCLRRSRPPPRKRYFQIFKTF